MKRDEALALLEGYRAELKKYGVKSIAVFGSVARNEATEGSDIDILVEFGQSVGLFEFVRIKTRLEKILNRPVDLVTPETLRNSIDTSPCMTRRAKRNTCLRASRRFSAAFPNPRTGAPIRKNCWPWESVITGRSFSNLTA